MFQELMSQKVEKPSLSGQRLKTRKRGKLLTVDIQYKLFTNACVD